MAIRLDRPEPGVAVLTLHRAQGPNIIDLETCEGLHEACAQLHRDASLHAVLLRAEGRNFCVGADVRDMALHLDHDLHAHLSTLIDAAHGAVLSMNRLPVPVIACVQGVAAGGGFALALACDSVIAARSARFVAAYAKLGTSPDTAFTHSLAERVGAQRAMALCLSPVPLAADAACSLGLVEEVVEDHALDAAGLAAARHLATLPRQAVVGTKALCNAAASQRMEARMQLEKAAFLRAAETADFRERVRSFAAQGA